MGLLVAFQVDGVAAPAGSKNSFVPTDKAGNPYRRKLPNGQPGGILVNTVDSCKASGPWKKLVGQVAKIAMRDAGLKPIDQPIKAIFRFYQSRPKAHYRTGKFSDVLRDDAPMWPAVKPDALKLTRAAEDGMTGIVYVDDALIVREVISKDYGGDFLRVEIWSMKG